MKIYDFIEEYCWTIPNSKKSQLFEFVSLSDTKRVSNLKKELGNELIFKNDEDFSNFISSRLAEYIYSNDFFLKDKPSIIKDIDNPYPYGCYDYPHYLKYTSLSDIMISWFALYEDNEFLVVDYENIPIYERSVIDFFIWNYCVDKIVDKLSKLTAFCIYKKQVKGVPYDILYTDFKVTQINNVSQIKMYVERNDYEKLRIFGNLLKVPIELDGKVMNIPRKDLPPFVELLIILEKKPKYSQYGWNGSLVFEKIRFQIIPNPNGSVSLKPYSVDIEDLIKKLLVFWDSVIISDEDVLLIPDKMKPIFDYLLINNIPTEYGVVKKVYEKEKSLEIARNTDKHRYEECYDDLISYYNYVFPLENYIHEDYIIALMIDGNRRDE